MITTREQLVDALHAASEIEHGLMCEYLFAAYSMKRSTSEGLSEVELERSRRWGSAITFIARQEMEHLGLVLNILSAIGADPYLGRPNFPQKNGYYGKDNPIEVALTKFDRPTIDLFIIYEAPPPPSNGPDELHPEDYKDLASLRHALIERGQRRLSANAGGHYQWRTAARPFPFKSVPDLYTKISEGISFLSQTTQDEARLFTGAPSAQIWGGPGSPYAGDMDDLNQYGLDLSPVIDAYSAHGAIARILLQGEGAKAPPGYEPHTHYVMFKEMAAAMGTLQVARNVVPNPLPEIPPGVDKSEVNLITNVDAAEIARLFNETYETMLVMMLFLYGYPRKTTNEAKGLTDAIFFPLMTMFVRQLSEVLTQLPAFADGKPGNAGPSFLLRFAQDTNANANANAASAKPPHEAGAVAWAHEKIAELDRSGIWEIFQLELDRLVGAFDRLSIFKHSSKYPQSVMAPMKLMRTDIKRLAFDWKTKWTEMGRQG